MRQDFYRAIRDEYMLEPPADGAPGVVVNPLETAIMEEPTRCRVELILQGVVAKENCTA